jgi:hypothetical protein
VLDFGATAIGAATFWQEGNDLLVQLRGSDSGVRVKDQFLATATSQIESFAFNGNWYVRDASVWTLPQSLVATALLAHSIVSML